MKLYLRTKKVEWKGILIRLSGLQCLFLIPLMEARGRVVKGREIGEFIFPDSKSKNRDRMVNTYAKRIDRKIPGMLGTKKGRGYYLRFKDRK